MDYNMAGDGLPPRTEDLQEIEQVTTAMVAAGELSVEEAEELIEQATSRIQQTEKSLELLGTMVENYFDEFAKKRAIKEQEWVDAIIQHQGGRAGGWKDESGYFEKAGGNNKPRVNITRPKDNLAISRMRDILFPLGGEGEIKFTPKIPAELDALQSDPQYSAEGQIAVQLDYERAMKMSETVKDALVAANFGKKARESIRDWVILGTAILKGPVPQTVPDNRYVNHPTEEGGMVSEYRRDFKTSPGIERTDPVYFYPEGDALCPEELSKAIELHPMTESDIIALADNPAFDRKGLRRVRELGPDGQREKNIASAVVFMSSDADFKSKYMVKEYRGPIDKDILYELGEISEEERDDPLVETCGEVWVCQGVVIKVALGVIEGYSKIPWNVVVWDKDDASLFGHGMPYLLKDQQRVINAAYQMLVDNTGLSAGPQIVLNKEIIEPQNQKWEMEPMKIWNMTEYGASVQEAVQFFNVPLNQEQITNVMTTAMDFADFESSSPMLSQSTQPQATNNTAAGQAMVLSEQNVSTRDLAMSYDDNILRPVHEGLYHYFMQHSDDPAIKGNFEIDMSGATQRIDNQLIAQEIEKILAMASSDPEYRYQIKGDALFRKWVSVSRLGPEALRTQAEAEAKMQEDQAAAEQQGPPPEVISAQAAMMAAEARKIEAETRAQSAQAEAQAKMAREQREAQKAQQDYELRLMELNDRELQRQADMNLAIMKMAQERDLTIAQIKKELGIAEMNNTTRTQIKQADLVKYEDEKALKKEYGTGV